MFYPINKIKLPSCSVLWIFCLLICLPSYPFYFYAESSQPKSADYPKYEGLLNVDDLRVEQLKKKISAGEKIPDTLKFIFSKFTGDFLEFYDKNGESVFIRYREDQFDVEAEKKYSTVTPGLAYEIYADFIGIKIDEKTTPLAGTKEFQILAQDKKAILVFRLISLKLLRTKQIRF